MTYYKYKERDVRVNWAALGADMVKTIEDEVADRDAQKAKIDEDSRVFAKDLSNVAFGDNKSANEAYIAFSSTASQARLMQDRLLKNGLLDVKTYTEQRQNLTDGANDYIAMFKEYNTLYSEHMERYRKGEAAEAEADDMQNLEQFADLNSTGSYVDPKTGNVIVAKVKEGKVSVDPADAVPIASLRKRIRSKINKFDVDNFTTEGAKGLAKKWEILSSQRGILTEDDVRNSPSWAKAKEDFVNIALVNPFDAAGILVDNFPFTKEGKRYKYTRDESMAGKSDEQYEYIYRKPTANGVFEPVLTEAQKKNAREAVMASLEVKVDREIVPTPRATGGGSGSVGEGTDWNKSKIASNEKITWSPVALKANGEVSTKRDSPIDVVAKADISASSTRADKTSSLQLMVHPQESDGMVITKPTQMQVKVQSYYQARDGGWYALGDVQKDVTPASAGVDEPRQMKTVNVVVPLDKENYNALNNHYNDGTFKFSTWLNSQGAAQQTTQTTNQTTATGDMSKYNKE